MMKKLCILCILLLLLISSGCSSNDSNDISDSDLKKAQAIAVTNADGTILTTITDQDAIDDFVTALQLDDWHLSERPKNAQIIGSFGLSQKKPSILMKQTTTANSMTLPSSISMTRPLSI